MSKHTPTPYHVGLRPGPIVYGPSGEMVADCRILTNTPDENKAIAAFIVRACNGYEGLIAACKAAETYCRLPFNEIDGAKAQAVADQCREARTKTKGI